jgi:hypothetical protein
VAHASLRLPELFTVTSEDVHPPLYYMLLGLWQGIVGVNLFAARYLAVLMSLPVIPLTYAVARAWAGGRVERRTRLALIAAALAAWLPLLVYYGAVIRMYALAPTFTLLAMWAALRLVKTPAAPSPSLMLAFVIGAAGAMLTLYHSAWALAALGLYTALLAVSGPRGTRMGRLLRLAGAVTLALLAYAPWALYALPQLQQRAAAETGNVAQQYPLGYFLVRGVRDLTMSQQIGDLGIIVMGLIILAGAAACVLAWVASRRTWRVEGGPWGVERPTFAALPLVLPVLVIAFTLLGVAAAARNWAFNARMLICAAPALALLLAWALDQLAGHARALAVIACLALIGVYWNTSTSFVYAKSLEVFDPYNPHTYYQHIAPQASEQDTVFFNVLGPAGFYALDRTPKDPDWSYALTWDPVIEPRERWEARITQAAQTHVRFWSVLYRGLAGANGDLRGWLDSTFYPAKAQWGEEEVFYGLYGAAREPMLDGAGAQTHWRGENGFDLELRTVQLPRSARAGDIIPIALTWRANAPLAQNDKIFVHAFDANGALVAQHDAQPLNDLRPMSSLPVGADVTDHHGLLLPPDFSGSLRIVVGIYDPATPRRLLNDRGQESVELGRVEVVR